ncbi:MFS transporter [Companilactobacillus jidongensis]|uniref:MFS transporter n=1 Tax=Companilactobacillus jidongensis TaxID=2486006 RepID=UPI00384F14A6
MSKRNLAIATVALLIANFMGGLDSTIVNTVLPAIMSDLNGIRLVGCISSAFLLGTAVTTVLWGRVGEIFGNKRVFQFSVALFILSSMLGGLSTNMVILIIARALMGIGAGGMVSIPFIIYADIYPNPAQRARALGWVTAFYTLSTVVGPLIGGWLVDALSWHWVFFINLPIGIISMLLLQFAYKDDRQANTKNGFDYIGAGLLSARVTDVTKQIDVDELVKLAQTKFGGLDVIFNNAGIMPSSPISALHTDEWDSMIDINLKGVLHGVAAVMPIFTAPKHGQIITTSSVAGIKSFTGAGVYGATKFAVRNLMEVIRMESAEEGTNIRTVSLYPAAINTELLHTITDKNTKKGMDEFYKQVGISPEAAANVVNFAIDQPEDVNVNEFTIYPTKQA